jgi:hypothetical protein
VAEFEWVSTVAPSILSRSWIAIDAGARMRPSVSACASSLTT